MAKEAPISDEYQYGFRDEHESIYKSGKGLTKEIVTSISKMKNEPQWMLDRKSVV